MRQDILIKTTRDGIFQSTHPHGVRLQSDFGLEICYPFQSTHPHGVRQGNVKKQQRRIDNFNPRTRTGCDALSPPTAARSSDISIHAPARGATRGKVWQSLRITISIHAPARGATEHTTRFPYGDSDFNPRTRTGCD